jgi:hypothetical protein
MKRRWVSAGVRALGLPGDWLTQLEKDARANRVHGDGSFCYLPQTVVVNDVVIELVTTLFDKRIKQGNINAHNGDVSFCLRSEWNEDENPLD